MLEPFEGEVVWRDPVVQKDGLLCISENGGCIGIVMESFPCESLQDFGLIGLLHKLWPYSYISVLKNHIVGKYVYHRNISK